MIEEFTYTKTIQLVDVDGTPIKEGSVLAHIEDDSRGVVVSIVRKGQTGYMFSGLGDMLIRLKAGTTRVSNQYSKWKHVPHDEQTYEELLISWLQQPYIHDEYSGISEGEGKAIDGIMQLLPSNVVDWDYGPFPDTLVDALQFLEKHLTSLKMKQTKKCKCGSKDGWYEKKVQWGEQHYLADGEPSFYEDTNGRGGKIKYCSECGRDITPCVED